MIGCSTYATCVGTYTYFILLLYIYHSSAPELKRYTQADTPLDVRLNIGMLQDDKMFAINGIQIQLSSLTRDASSIPLPGIHGPRPHLSNGVHQVNVLKDGTFINME